MDLINEFSVDVPLERAWAVLTDVETIAPCLPGAQLQEVEGDEFRGVVKVKVGPITANYKGTATFVELDEESRRAVIRAEGRETRGQGNASAVITAELVGTGPSSTDVRVTTDLTVTGKVAQFGRGVMADVSGKLMNQFADNLSTTVLAPGAPEAPAAAEAPAAPEPAATPSPSAAPEAPTGSAEAPAPAPSATSANGATSGARKIDSPEATPIDLLDAAGGSVMRRALPAVGVLVLVLLILRAIRRRSS
jgi:carbon monoxide dehydrogenase subunit G